MASEEHDRVTTFELFFDLAYVFAITQVTGLMAARHDALGVARALVVLALIWWSWTAYAWLSNHARADRGAVRVAMVVAMAAVFVAGLAVHETFEWADGERFAPLVFVGAYLVARTAHTIVYLFAGFESAGLRRQVVVAVGLSLLPSIVLLVGGVLLGPPWQLWCWSGAAAVEPLVAFVRGRGVDWRLHSVDHFVERYGLVVILALGESVIAVGAGVSDEPLSAAIVAGAVLAILVAVGMWWAYFSQLAGRAEQALERAVGPVRASAANDGYTYLHLALVAGIVCAALGVEQAMHHVADPERFGAFGATMLAGGLAWYVAGTAAFALLVLGEWWSMRLVGAGLLVGTAPLLAELRPLAALGTAAAAFAVVLVASSRVERARDPEG